MNERLRSAPAAERNKVPILATLQEVLPRSGRLLEIASGFGQHALFLAEHLPDWTLVPSDVARDHVNTIDAWRGTHPLANLEAPRVIDVEKLPWPTSERFDVVLNINMIHISPWSAALALFDGARDVLRPGGLLITYGPYRLGGEHTAPTNAAFDERLRSMDPRFGIRDLEALDELASTRDLTPNDRFAMPANNFLLTFERA
ncbi:MAG: DUF938 domain-containing protein [Myxococcota bacterium]